MQMIHTINIVFALNLFSQFSYEACYDFIQEQQKIVSPSPSNRKYFGDSVVLSNGYLIIGSKFDSENGFNAGGAHVYNNVHGEWIHRAKLIPSTGKAYGECGSTLAADGHLLLVGCPRDSSIFVNSGSVHVFQLVNSTWIETHLLRPLEGKVNGYFGRSLGIHENTLIVNSNIDVVGLAYIYKLKSGEWHKMGKLEYSSNTFGLVPFSHAVAIYGSHAIVGRWYDNKNGHQSGSAVIFRENGGKWKVEAELRPSDGTHADWFGMSVAVSSRYAVVSSHGDDVNETDGSGSAYVFEYVQGKWLESWKLTSRTPTSGESFGYPVVISKDTIIVGSIGYDSEAHNSGGSYVFQRSSDGNWTEVYKLLPSDGEYNGIFGYSLAVENDVVAVSSLRQEDKTGSVYMFKVGNDTSVLCDNEIYESGEVDYMLVVYIVAPVLLVLVVVVVVVWMCRRKNNVAETGQDEAKLMYHQDVPKETEII